MASVGGDGGETLSLNIMPMLDIFSILLTFLLMSYSTDPTQHDVDENLELPDSVTLVTMDEVPSIVVNRNEIYVNDNKIVDLQNGKIPEDDVFQGGINSVFKELKKLAIQNQKVASNLTDPEDKKKSKPGTITIEMDRKHDFRLLRRIMISGQQAEFIRFKLMVAKETI
ncbi:ExbD/TolR family protein [Pseudobacteriovorax antillogorgiicola]|uniref:Biopolymer transport protein ExbD/TolR n=1 Tax=Pseudobacteriovorax antillogorgiicola TaxID=1513793 RepID=A0A1Y6CG06_9BACT|nr:biopolymer transporter ExbD [Pseudobacteriovorax antillogorgiicola]TCS47277.1 biopolymer transport protein ExbD/TolR [Pseudobacteriovorax antillogorgiicola]SMF62260.1 Biopolymer transport protein ExbD/TolR [Pseudobacteriovorax antillogorgiicola]